MSGPARHIAIVAPPLAGHLDPLLVLGEALVARGHRVTLLALGDLAPLVARSTLEFAALGGARDRPGAVAAYRAVMARPTGPIGFARMIRTTAAAAGHLLDALPAAVERLGADAMIADATEPAAALVARRLGLPFVTSVTGLPLLREGGVPPPYVGWHYRAGAIGRWRNWGGYAVVDRLLAPITGVLAERARAWGLAWRADDDASPLLQIAQCPAGLDVPRAVLPPAFRYGGPWRRAATANESVPDDGRPLVYCSLGSLQGGRAAVFATMTRACAAVGARAVVAHGGGLTEPQAAALPGDPLVRGFWSQPAMLPRCAGAVLHGGFNTVLDALAAGVPIVAVPIAFEQPATAARIARIGAGRVVPAARLTPARLIRALAQILGDPGPRATAARLAQEIAGAGGVERAAALVDAAFRSGRTPPA